jgi:plasmid stability protein
MNKHIQIRNVPDGLHCKLKMRAIGKGLSLSDYLRQELERLANRPTWEEVAKKLRELPAVRLPPDTIANIIREEREARDEHLMNVLKQNRK